MDKEDDMKPNTSSYRPPYTSGDPDKFTMIQQQATHAVQIQNLQSDVHEIRADVKMILSQLSSNSGSWKVVLLLCGAAGFVISAVINILSLFKVH